MKSRKTLIITIAVVVLGIATLVVVLTRGRSRTFSQDLRLLPVRVVY